MEITNRLNLPLGFLRAASTEKHNEKGQLSATTLLQGVKQIILTDRHWSELRDDVSDRIWAIWGQAVHSLLEQEGENEFSEQKMSYPVGKITVTGRIDNYDMKDGIICDYKTASVWKIKLGDYSDWYLQGMVYAWLLAKNGFPVQRCRFIALLKDHSRSEILRDSGYPKSPVEVYEFPVTFTGLMKIDGYIRKKVKEYARCRELPDEDIPACAPEERWDRPAKYAVMKTGRKTAVRLLDQYKAAEKLAGDLGAGHYVEHRPGESIKCRSFCLCREFCDYYRLHIKGPALARAAA
jgi:hypothetical protein